MQAEAALRESEKRFQIIIKNSPVTFFLQDDELRYQWLYGIPGSPAGNLIIGKTDQEIYPEAEALFLNRQKRSVLEEGTGRSFEFVLGSEETQAIYQISLEPYRDSNQVIGVYGVSFDITEQKKAENTLKRDRETFEKLVEDRSAELSAAQLELVKAKRLSDIGTLAATVAHELRNPLAAINVAVANIKRKAANPLLDGHLNTISKKVFESDQIINNLLFFSRIRNPRMENTAICDIIEECVEITAHGFKKDIALKKSLSALRNITVSADPTQLKEVFVNVLNNAHDAVPESGGKIEIRTAAGPDCITVLFKDNGTGIEEQDLARAFEPFFTTKAKGTGLGLVVSLQIISLHNGEINIESKVGRGTSVTVKLPRHR